MCSPSRGAGRVTAPGVAESFTGSPSVSTRPATGRSVAVTISRARTCGWFKFLGQIPDNLRTEFSPQGVLGGRPGRPRQIRINGEVVHPKGRYTLAPGDRIVTLEAGGGGYGDPALRDPGRIRRDIEAGHVTREQARSDYGERS